MHRACPSGRGEDAQHAGGARGRVAGGRRRVEEEEDESDKASSDPLSESDEDEDGSGSGSEDSDDAGSEYLISVHPHLSLLTTVHFHNRALGRQH